MISIMGLPFILQGSCVSDVEGKFCGHGIHF
jgi:hypothetical protein